MKQLIWNVDTKNARKCSNISVKKYQNNPIFGVSSGTVTINPIVDVTNVHEWSISKNEE